MPEILYISHVSIGTLGVTMLFIIVLFVVTFTTVSSNNADLLRISGGQLAQIIQYPETVGLLYSNFGHVYIQTCAGIIVTKKSVVTAAHCISGDTATQWRVRAGSSYANSGGTVYHFHSITVHPNFNKSNFDNDIAILRTNTDITYGILVKQANIAGSNYKLADNEVVWAVGWGKTSYDSSKSEQLRHVQFWTINQELCKTRYAMISSDITDNMLCAGWVDVGVRDQCQGDSGGPLYHEGNVVGICSWGKQCALGQYPGVNTRISKFTPWIQANA